MKPFDIGDTTFVAIGNVIVPVGDVRYIQRGLSDGVTQRFQVALKGYGDTDTLFVEGIATTDEFLVEDE